MHIGKEKDINKRQKVSFFYKTNYKKIRVPQRQDFSVKSSKTIRCLNINTLLILKPN